MPKYDFNTVAKQRVLMFLDPRLSAVTFGPRSSATKILQEHIYEQRISLIQDYTYSTHSESYSERPWRPK